MGRIAQLLRLPRILDEGVQLAAREHYNFIGAAVTAVLDPVNTDRINITIDPVAGGAVPATRQVNTSGGILGGGDLTIDRTHTLDYGLTAEMLGGAALNATGAIARPAHVDHQHAQGEIWSCPASVAVGDAVYRSADLTVDKAFAGTPGQTPDAFGIVVEKPTATSARVHPLGLTPTGVLAGLTSGATYFLSDVTAGAITATAPTAAGTKIQEIGFAASATRLYAWPDATSIIN